MTSQFCTNTISKTSTQFSAWLQLEIKYDVSVVVKVFESGGFCFFKTFANYFYLSFNISGPVIEVSWMKCQEYTTTWVFKN